MKTKITGFKFWLLPALVALMAVLSSFASSGSIPPVQADPGHTGDSLNVAIIGSPGVINGGTFPTAGGGFAAFTFTNLAPGSVSTANLAAFDTVLLNVASPAIGCNLAINLSAAAKTDLVTFVAGGNKLIIYDSECSPQDYSWLPFPFTTQNPGAAGATGTLTIVEENTLSTNAPGPHFINAPLLGSSTDAVGDMNVMITLDPNWCLDMSGTNVSGTTGPVHTYARHGTVGSVGLVIYNGLDVDYMSAGITGSAELEEIWLQELEQPTNPDGLPCEVPVVGIKLDPPTDTNPAGTDHTVTATVTDLLGAPTSGVLVSFSVTAGPNTAATGVCVPPTCLTDALGQVTWTYTSNGTGGTDTIQACFGTDTPVCAEAEKTWLVEICGDGIDNDGDGLVDEGCNVAPDCTKATANPSLLWPPNHKFVPITIIGVTDADGDAVTVTVTSIRQDEQVKSKSSGNTSPDGKIAAGKAEVRAERNGDPKTPGNGRVYYIGFEASDGIAKCTGTVQVGVPHDQGAHNVPIGEGPLYDSTVP